MFYDIRWADYVVNFDYTSFLNVRSIFGLLFGARLLRHPDVDGLDVPVDNIELDIAPSGGGNQQGHRVQHVPQVVNCDQRVFRREINCRNRLVVVGLVIRLCL